MDRDRKKVLGHARRELGHTMREVGHVRRLLGHTKRVFGRGRLSATWQTTWDGGSHFRDVLSLLLPDIVQIFVEVERARLVRKEAEMLEEDGKIDEAALLLQEVQVRE